MFNLFRAQEPRVHYGTVWPYREGATYVDRHYSILAPAVCTSCYHGFLGNPDIVNGVCPACRQKQAQGLRAMSERAACRVSEFKDGLATLNEVLDGYPQAAQHNPQWNGALDLDELVGVFETVAQEHVPFDCGYSEARYFVECALLGKDY